VKKIFVALSGGVDSAVAAALLVRAGHDVTGIYMKNWSSSEGLLGDCPYLADRRDAIRVAAHLGISFREVDFEEQYRATVYSYFIDSYRAGRTPNPDVLCNREIKFGLLLDYALENGADALATGHYARIHSVPSVTLSEAEGPGQTSEVDSLDSSTRSPERPAQNDREEYHLRRARDRNKDQSYFLHQLTQKQLSKALFPLGELTKPEVRALAREFGLPNAECKDSQGLCFIGKIDLADFLRTEIPGEPGEIVDELGERIGTHPGAAYYTLGQREGLGVALAERRYVVATDVEKNVVRLGEEAKLYRGEILLQNLHWIGQKPEFPLSCQAQVRYRARPVGALLHADGRLELEEPVRAPAPGQFAALLRGEQVLGGGEIS
jgi:tRNA-uridine 2-sulfurtransferase